MGSDTAPAIWGGENWHRKYCYCGPTVSHTSIVSIFLANGMLHTSSIPNLHFYFVLFFYIFQLKLKTSVCVGCALFMLCYVIVCKCHLNNVDWKLIRAHIAGGAVIAKQYIVWCGYVRHRMNILDKQFSNRLRSSHTKTRYVSILFFFLTVWKCYKHFVWTHRLQISCAFSIYALNKQSIVRLITNREYKYTDWILLFTDYWRILHHRTELHNYTNLHAHRFVNYRWISVRSITKSMVHFSRSNGYWINAFSYYHRDHKP